MTLDEIRKKKPDGATHHDGMDYWKFKDGMWFIWFSSNNTWNHIIDYVIFHKEFGIKPLY